MSIRKNEQFPDRERVVRPDHHHREARRLELTEMAKKACDKFGGCALIDDKYAFVDITKFNITDRRTQRIQYDDN